MRRRKSELFLGDMQREFPNFFTKYHLVRDRNDMSDNILQAIFNGVVATVRAESIALRFASLADRFYICVRSATGRGKWRDIASLIPEAGALEGATWQTMIAVLDANWARVCSSFEDKSARDRY